MTSGRARSEAGKGCFPQSISPPSFSPSTSALFHLGLIADTQSGKPGERNLPLARQTIDILEILEIKTRGNLDPEEAKLLESLLFEIRMRFVEANR